MRLVLLRTGETYVSGRIMEDKSIDTATPERIIELFFGRDEQAIEMTDRLYRGQLLKIAYNITRDFMISEEVLNDAYLALWNRIPPARPGSLRAYSSVIVRNIAVDRMRKNGADKRDGNVTALIEELEECLPGGESAEDRYIASELSSAVNRFYGTISKKEKDVFVARYFSGFDISSIAHAFHISEDYARTMLLRTRKKLKKFLQKENLL